MQRDRGARAGTLRVVPTGSEVPGPQGCALLSTEGGASGCETADERPESGSLGFEFDVSIGVARGLAQGAGRD